MGQIFAMSNYMGEHKVQLRTKTTFILSTTFFLSNSSVEHYIHTRLAIKDSYIYQQMQLEQPIIICSGIIQNITLVPEVFIDVRESREAVKTSQEAAGREKPQVTLDLILTFIQTPAAKRIKLIITKGTNSTLPIQA